MLTTTSCSRSTGTTTNPSSFMRAVRSSSRRAAGPAVAASSWSADRSTDTCGGRTSSTGAVISDDSKRK
jgi:hypothetical protein